MAVELGLTLPQRGVLFQATSVSEMLLLARLVDEDLRFSSLWVGDSVLAKPRPDSLALLGALTAVTRRVRLGTGCMASFPVRDPLVFAHEWATLDLLSGGRMELAVCTGIVGGGLSAHEGKQWGITDRDRAGILEEYIEICRAFWAGEAVDRISTRFSYQKAVLGMTPVQDPCPIWIASNPPIEKSERPLRRVAKMADGWMTAEIGRGRFGSLWGRLSDLLAAEGRDPESFPTIAYHNINIDDDAGQAFQESKHFLDTYYGPVFSDESVRSWTALGSPEQCAEQIQELVDSGAKAVTLRIASWKQQEQFERLVTEVIPRMG